MSPPLPPLHVAMVDRDGLLALMGDIEACGTLLGISVKRGPQALSDAQAPQLQDAVRALIEGAALGLQVRYVHEGRQWWDTILRAGDGFRIVRIDHGHTLEG